MSDFREMREQINKIIYTEVEKTIGQYLALPGHEREQNAIQEAMRLSFRIRLLEDERDDLIDKIVRWRERAKQAEQSLISANAQIFELQRKRSVFSKLFPWNLPVGSKPKEGEHNEAP